MVQPRQHEKNLAAKNGDSFFATKHNNDTKNLIILSLRARAPLVRALHFDAAKLHRAVN